MSIHREIMLHKARLADEEKEREKLLSRIDGCVTILREIIDPYDMDNCSSWDTNKLRVINEDLCLAIEDVRRKTEKIDQIRKDLGC